MYSDYTLPANLSFNFCIIGLEDVVSLANDIILAAHSNAQDCRDVTSKIVVTIREAIEKPNLSISGGKNDGKCCKCHVFLRPIDADLLCTILGSLDNTSIYDLIEATSPLKRHQELHENVPENILESLQVLLKLQNKQLNTRMLIGTPVFELIDGITKMGGNQNFVSLYRFNRIVETHAEEEQCKLCSFYFESSYLNNTHTSLCRPVKHCNKEVMEAVQTLASYALEKSGVAHPIKASNHTGKSV